MTDQELRQIITEFISGLQGETGASEDEVRQKLSDLVNDAFEDLPE